MALICIRRVVLSLWILGCGAGEPIARDQLALPSDSVNGGPMIDSDHTADYFVNTLPSNACRVKWEGWPLANARALENDNVLVLQVFAAIGNLFITIGQLMAVAHFLGAGLALDWKERFPGFRQAFDPADISWDVDATRLRQRVLNIKQGDEISNELQVTMFQDGMILLSNAQLEMLTTALVLPTGNLDDLVSAVCDTTPRTMRNFLALITMRLSRDANVDTSVESCAWNMLLRPSPSLLAALRTYSPWAKGDDSITTLELRSKNYVAWHLRIPTEADRRTGYNPKVHSYMFQEAPDTICSMFREAMESAQRRCPELFTADTNVYISSISTALGNSCIANLAAHNVQGVQVDMGLNADEAHTQFNSNPDSAINAFLDYMFLMDANVIVRTGSSFSGTVASIRGFTCRKEIDSSFPERHLFVCFPKEFSC